MLSVTGARIPSHLRVSIPKIAEGCQHAASCIVRISAARPPRPEQKAKLQWFSCTEQLLRSTDQVGVLAQQLLDFGGGSRPTGVARSRFCRHPHVVGWIPTWLQGLGLPQPRPSPSVSSCPPRPAVGCVRGAFLLVFGAGRWALHPALLPARWRSEVHAS